MVALHRSNTHHPVIHIYVLYLQAPSHHSTRNEEMVELLGDTIVHVSVTFLWRNIRGFIDFSQERCKGIENADCKCELVAVSTHDDRHVGICVKRALEEDYVDDVLSTKMMPIKLARGNSRI